MFEDLPVALVVARPDGEIVLENRQVPATLGHSLVGRTGFPPPHDPHDGDGPIEFRYTHGDGHDIWLRATSAAVARAGHAPAVITLFRNVDREKAIEATLVASSEQRTLAQIVARIGHFEWDIANDRNNWSPELEALYGLPPGGFEGSYAAWRARVHADDLAAAEAELARAIAAGDNFAAEWRAIWPDGTIRWILARAKIFCAADGTPERMLGINMDVTAQKEAEAGRKAAELRLQFALEAGRLGAWHLDVAALKLTCTAGCKANFGRAATEPFDYQDFRASIHPDDRDRVAAAIEQAIVTGDDYFSEYRVVWPDGSIRWIEARGHPSDGADGQPLVMDGVTADVTERHHLDEFRRAQAESLVVADRRKDQFLAVLSHELRSPLSATTGAVELLKARPGDPAIVELARTVIERQTRQITRLVDDLLEVSRITQGKIAFAPAPLDLRGVVEAAADTVRPSIEGRRQQLEVTTADQPVMVEGDVSRLTQVVVNLLNNASKYTDVGGTISVALSTHGGAATCTVRDRGVGIHADALATIFEPLTQLAEHRTRSQGGLGLGLAVVRHLIDLHGGTVVAHSDGPGQGSTFTVSLPLLRRTADSGGRGRQTTAVGAASPAASS